MILGQGGLLVVFPEGTRVDDPHALGGAHHGAGRLALDAQSPIVPAAIVGTSRLWLGPVPKPRRVRVAFLPAIDRGGCGAARTRSASWSIVSCGRPCGGSMATSSPARA